MRTTTVLKRGVPVGIGLSLMGIGWTLLWTQDTFWNPLFFMGMWSGATLLMYGAGKWGYPGLRRHLLLLALSIPLWWWFEVVNARVGNWEYLGAAGRYNRWQYILMSSAAFSTVIPAMDAAWGLMVRGGWSAVGLVGRRSLWYGIQMGVGILFQGMVFIWPKVFYPFVWVAPFLVADGLVGYRGGRSLVDDMMGRRWRLVVGVAMGGLLCGFLWEFWNFWSTPKWIYHVPLLGFGHVFEMPVLGYGGYVPFAWSIYQLLRLGPVGRIIEAQGEGEVGSRDQKRSGTLR
ncbi:MAG: hypothetical protein ABID84_02705 [Chloroflexota bacterium]